MVAWSGCRPPTISRYATSRTQRAQSDGSIAPLAVAIQQQRDHHRRVERRPAMTIGPVAAAKRTQIQRVHRVQHHDHHIVLGQPIPHVHRHQQRLITLRVKEVLRHTP